jgi:hypothetical protein
MKAAHQLIGEWLRFRWQSNPVEATFMGVHDYDTQLGDYGPDHLDERRSKEADFLRRLRETSAEEMSLPDSIDRRLALAELECDQKLLEQASPWARDACIYLELCLGGLFLPLVRDYAPLEDRVHSIVARLMEIPKVLVQAQASLRKPVQPFAELALEIAVGGKQFIRGALPTLGDKVPSLAADLTRSIQTACDAFEEYEDHLRERVLPTAESRFALGRELFEFLLRERHLLPFDAQDLLTIGEESIGTTLQEMRRLTHQHRPTASWMDWVEEIKGRHPDGRSLKDAYGRAMVEARNFVIENDLVTVPPG